MNVVPLTRVQLGGSSAAAAAGVDPYRSRIMLWLELTGRVQRDESEAMRWGRLIEPLIFDELAAREYEVEPAGDVELRDAERPWLVGHPDGWARVDDEDALVEVKTAGPWAWQGDEPPVAYVAQVQHYLHLSGLNVGLLAVLVAGQKLHVHTIRRQERAIELLLRLEAEFVGYVQRDTPPPVDGSDSAREALGLLYPQARQGASVRLTGEAWEWCKALAARKAQAKALDAQITELENRLKAVMGEAETAVSPFDAPALRWPTVESTRLDVARLKAELPTIHAEYAATTTTRRFSVV